MIVDTVPDKVGVLMKRLLLLLLFTGVRWCGLAVQGLRHHGLDNARLGGARVGSELVHNHPYRGRSAKEAEGSGLVPQPGYHQRLIQPGLISQTGFGQRWACSLGAEALQVGPAADRFYLTDTELGLGLAGPLRYTSGPAEEPGA